MKMTDRQQNLSFLFEKILKQFDDLIHLLNSTTVMFMKLRLIFLNFTFKCSFSGCCRFTFVLLLIKVIWETFVAPSGVWWSDYDHHYCCVGDKCLFFLSVNHFFYNQTSIFIIWSKTKHKSGSPYLKIQSHSYCCYPLKGSIAVVLYHYH